MRNRFRPSHGTVVAYVALFVALGGTAVAANGGNFILGQSNSAGNPTQLSSPTTNAAGALKVTNTNTTTAGRGISAVGGAGGYGLYASGGNRSKGTPRCHPAPPVTLADGYPAGRGRRLGWRKLAR